MLCIEKIHTIFNQAHRHSFCRQSESDPSFLIVPRTCAKWYMTLVRLHSCKCFIPSTASSKKSLGISTKLKQITWTRPLTAYLMLSYAETGHNTIRLTVSACTEWELTVCTCTDGKLLE